MNYRELLTPAALLLPLALGAQEAERRPNVIFIMTDDQGKNDIACEGNRYIKTPTIDKIHSEAIRFTNYHVSTTSAPSRGAIMTGRHTNRINCFHTINGRSLLFEDETILPQIFAQNGYTNGMFGKWHLGDNYPMRPEDRGFHEVVRHGGGGVGQGPDYWDNDYFDDTYWHNGKVEEYEGYCTDVFFDNAINFIENNQDGPFFCYIATNAPHAPFNVPEEYLRMYDDGVKMPDGSDLPENTRRFCGMITNIDDNIARLEKRLEELGLKENTILIFTTDNGTGGGFGMHDAGMKGAKGSVYEGGHRVPFYIRWPKGGMTGGRDMDKLVAHYDLLPTFVDLLDFDYMPNPAKPLDGTSIKPLIYGDEEGWPNRILYMDTQRMQDLVKYKAYTVMDDNWRLVNGTELYDMRCDLGQTNNVIEQHPEVVDRLSNGYERWWSSIIGEGVNERYGYIKAGSKKENPLRISAHDLLTDKLTAWHQTGAITAGQTYGVWKIEVVERGDYKISLCRFPRESGLEINATFPEAEPKVEIQRINPASTKDDFVKATVSIAGFVGEKEVEAGAGEVSFEAQLSEGKYDLRANLIDKIGGVYPAYYIYIEKL